MWRDVESSNLNKKHLQRYLSLVIINDAQIELQNIQNTIEYNELIRAINLVHRRFNFDHNWFTCLGLIQLHENLIKKKLIQLGEEINKDDKIPTLIDKLIRLIKKKENRDVMLDILMSQGLKQNRDIMTHEGYKHKVSKNTLKKIIKEIENLESVLFPKIS